MNVPLDRKNLPADFGKMPANYDFSTKSTLFPFLFNLILEFNWAEYNNDFMLRTDAVWEKDKLKTYFLNYMKVQLIISTLANGIGLLFR